MTTPAEGDALDEQDTESAQPSESPHEPDDPRSTEEVSDSDDEADVEPAADAEVTAGRPDSAAPDGAEHGDVTGDEALPVEENAPAGRWPLVVTALVAGVAVLGTVVGVLAALVTSGVDAAQRHETVVATAEQVATGLLRLDFESAPGTIEGMLAVSTGPLRQQLTALSPTLNSLLDQGQVSSDGVVTASGVELIDDRSAQVLVAADATVRNSELPDGQLRTYRMVVTVQREGDLWLASAVDFVA